MDGDLAWSKWGRATFLTATLFRSEGAKRAWGHLHIPSRVDFDVTLITLLVEYVGYGGYEKKSGIHAEWDRIGVLSCKGYTTARTQRIRYDGETEATMKTQVRQARAGGRKKRGP